MPEFGRDTMGQKAVLGLIAAASVAGVVGLFAFQVHGIVDDSAVAARAREIPTATRISASTPSASAAAGAATRSPACRGRSARSTHR